MTPRISVLFAAIAVLALGVLPAAAQQTRMQYDKNGRAYYGQQGPNRVIQQGPNTRVYITTRSWLDAGTEVLPLNVTLARRTLALGALVEILPTLRLTLQPLAPPTQLLL